MHQTLGTADGSVGRNPCHDYTKKNEADETGSGYPAGRWAPAHGDPKAHLEGSPPTSKRWTSSSVSAGSRFSVTSLKSIEFINPIRSSRNCNDVLRTPIP